MRPLRPCITMLVTRESWFLQAYSNRAVGDADMLAANELATHDTLQTWRGGSPCFCQLLGGFVAQAGASAGEQAGAGMRMSHAPDLPCGPDPLIILIIPVANVPRRPSLVPSSTPPPPSIPIFPCDRSEGSEKIPHSSNSTLLSRVVSRVPFLHTGVLCSAGFSLEHDWPQNCAFATCSAELSAMAMLGSTGTHAYTYTLLLAANAIHWTSSSWPLDVAFDSSTSEGSMASSDPALQLATWSL